MKQIHTEAFVTFLLKSPYKNGARKAPAKAPQEIPISWAMKVGGFRAITTEITIKKTIKTRIIRRVFFSSSFLQTVSFNTSRVRVELEVKTSEERVDIDAERTKTTTIPIKISGRVASICGTIESYIIFPLAP